MSPKTGSQDAFPHRYWPPPISRAGELVPYCCLCNIQAETVNLKQRIEVLEEQNRLLLMMLGDEKSPNALAELDRTEFAAAKRAPKQALAEEKP